MLFKVENLNLIYDIGKEDQTYALRNINLSLEGKRLIGIMGPSGSGKSSLLYSLAGLKIPSSGTISYMDMKFKELSVSKNAQLRRANFGFVFQRHFLIDYMSVIDNVLTPINDNSTKAKEKALGLLEKLGIKHLANKKPHQLSGGQRQKAAIARALINDPKVIFCDEITASLDHSSARDVMKLLDEYKNSALVIVVTHDASILGNADDIINIWDGQITSVKKSKINYIETEGYDESAINI
ncbi:ABC transporter ATP-binding protein [Clostridium lacusfryxellense]|uniref:ABC transporter ATP-binding protein n=1 Tax=Clostridium lacusfryxellense TaxID=205328 RepID=UPI001C0C5573|nr:ABC transporter ATP-binding protein [Clostridium lacusfryxellense]MBU3114377.1 ABC transporter ATP-binding protein [Clostridium lacusfryxellense]